MCKLAEGELKIVLGLGLQEFLPYGLAHFLFACLIAPHICTFTSGVRLVRGQQKFKINTTYCR